MITTVPPKWGTVVFYACGADQAGTAVATTIRRGAAINAAPLRDYHLPYPSDRKFF